MVSEYCYYTLVSNITITFSSEQYQTIVLNRCLKQVQNFILKFSISGSFFSEKGLFCILWYLFLFLLVDVLVSLSRIKKVIKDVNIYVFFSITH